MGAMIAPGSGEVASKRGTRPADVARLEESEAKSAEWSPPARAQDPARPGRSPLAEDAEMVNAARGIMHLGKGFQVRLASCIFLFSLLLWMFCLRFIGGLAEAMVAGGASGDRPVSPSWDLAREGLERLPKASGLLGPSLPGQTGGEGLLSPLFFLRVFFVAFHL